MYSLWRHKSKSSDPIELKIELRTFQTISDRLKKQILDVRSCRPNKRTKLNDLVLLLVFKFFSKTQSKTFCLTFKLFSSDAPIPRLHSIPILDTDTTCEISHPGEKQGKSKNLIVQKSTLKFFNAAGQKPG